MGKALGIVYRSIATHLTHKAGYKNSTAHTGAVTLIQRFGSALDLNIHFHMLFLDGVYVGEASSSSRFRWVTEPTSYELTQLTRTVWPDIWSARDCWCEMPSTVISRWIARMKTRWINCEGIPLLTALRWVPNKAVKSSPYKRCPTNAMPMIPRLSAASLDYSGHPALRPSGLPSAVQNRSRRFCLPARQCGGQSQSA